MKLKIISQKEAEYLMMAPTVLGGWVMVGCDAANRVTLWDNICQMSREYGIHYLALLPDGMSEGIPADRSEVMAAVAFAIAHASNRTWAKASKDADVALLREWQSRIEATA